MIFQASLTLHCAMQLACCHRYPGHTFHTFYRYEHQKLSSLSVTYGFKRGLTKPQLSLNYYRLTLQIIITDFAGAPLVFD